MKNSLLANSGAFAAMLINVRCPCQINKLINKDRLLKYDASTILKVVITKSYVLWKWFFEIELVWQKSQAPFSWFIPNFINNILRGINVLSNFLKRSKTQTTM